MTKMKSVLPVCRSTMVWLFVSQCIQYIGSILETDLGQITVLDWPRPEAVGLQCWNVTSYLGSTEIRLLAAARGQALCRPAWKMPHDITLHVRELKRAWWMPGERGAGWGGAGEAALWAVKRVLIKEVKGFCEQTECDWWFTITVGDGCQNWPVQKLKNVC